MSADLEELLKLFDEDSTSSSLENKKKDDADEELLDILAFFNDNETETTDVNGSGDIRSGAHLEENDMAAWGELEAELMVEENEVMSEEKDNDSGFSGTDNFTFSPGCCGKITSSGSCDATKATIKRTSNADLAANALRLNMVSSFSSFRADLVSSITNFCIVYVAQ